MGGKIGKHPMPKERSKVILCKEEGELHVATKNWFSFKINFSLNRIQFLLPSSRPSETISEDMLPGLCWIKNKAHMIDTPLRFLQLVFLFTMKSCR